jgi:N-acetylmuramate 1-kinase
MSDTRLQHIGDWLASLHIDSTGIQPASADASFRRYFRVIDKGKPWIVMDAPPDKESLEPFVSLSGYLCGLGLQAPAVRAMNREAGFLLLSDLGKTPYLDRLRADEVSAGQLYSPAIRSILVMQKNQPDFDLPRYDHQLLMQEMLLFRDWYLKKHLHTDDGGELDAIFQLLAEAALEQPVAFVHRDYHSRNLMVLDDGPGILDFQDAVMGPISYDLVSLLRDCYIRWPDEQVRAWVDGYYQQLDTPEFDRKTLQYWFDMMGVQRHLKAVGIFARLNYRDGKPGYLGDIPRVMGYLRAMVARYPKLEILGRYCITDATTTV